jgi:hypothetical protein
MGASPPWAEYCVRYASDDIPTAVYLIGLNDPWNEPPLAADSKAFSCNELGDFRAAYQPSKNPPSTPNLIPFSYLDEFRRPSLSRRSGTGTPEGIANHGLPPASVETYVSAPGICDAALPHEN